MQSAINGHDFGQSGRFGFSTGQQDMSSAMSDIDRAEAACTTAPLADTANGPAISPKTARIGSNLRSQMPTLIGFRMPQASR